MTRDEIKAELAVIGSSYDGRRWNHADLDRGKALVHELTRGQDRGTVCDACGTAL